MDPDAWKHCLTTKMVLKHTEINIMLFITSKPLLGFLFYVSEKDCRISHKFIELIVHQSTQWNCSVNFCLIYFGSTLLGAYGFMSSGWHFMSYNFSFINVNALKSILPNNTDFILPFAFKIVGFIFKMNLLSSHSIIFYFFTQFFIQFI